ncbi:MAG: methyltransferase domain-containing protein [Gammaproteobacteria bacterium]|nr:methyltransferase domain-containing protein [Gammaproteobacteria bacterium]NIM74092.1 methyltransferase domain-containing protein [Gammaproteobacteria bacterium]NIN38975.1 methyltransferase domain-containing protein [Gammaproteobacteria bacterium]NIO25868.1 methyltransferase domain-containing protein [Gammaproteobacteria bacterium]NIO66499.1 methyltransferase domain-containing protein [Gammaproteobacteria bacterium]
MSSATNLAIDWTEKGWIPDLLIRQGIRRLLKRRLNDINADDCERMARQCEEFVAELDKASIAPVPEKANEQHYEVPAAFFYEVLGRHRKYSCCYWSQGTTSLDEAESESLRITCERAGIEDGMEILELGCGWGSLTLWMAENYPHANITAVSNSSSQRVHISREALRRGINNVEVITADMNDFSIERRFNRVVSVEMFEHMRNYRELFRRVHDWLLPGGRFFMHIFCHRTAPYEFIDQGADDWMSRHFFTGGIMPSEDLPLRFQDHLKLLKTWRWDGKHYEKTANAWLNNMDLRRGRIWPILVETYGSEHAMQWWMRWRIFFMACAELFGYQNGQQWWVAHYCFERPDNSA